MISISFVQPRLLCRLTPPLCLNFLCLAHLDSHVIPASAPLPASNDVPSAVPQTTQAFNATVETQLLTLAIENNATTTPSPPPPQLFLETSFTKFMGHLDVVPFIASGFNVYFPIAVLVLCLFTFFRLGSRILHCLGIPQLLDYSPNTGDDGKGGRGDPLINDTVEDGKMLLQRGEHRCNLLPSYGV